MGDNSIYDFGFMIYDLPAVPALEKIVNRKS
jgi:hypothetical protein